MVGEEEEEGITGGILLLKVVTVGGHLRNMIDKVVFVVGTRQLRVKEMIIIIVRLETTRDNPRVGQIGVNLVLADILLSRDRHLHHLVGVLPLLLGMLVHHLPLRM